MTGVRAFVFGPKSGWLTVWSGRTGPVADFRIKVDVKAAQKQLSDMAKQIPFAASVALNDLAFQVMRKENSAMSDIFKDPRPFTQRATQVEKKASKSDLTAVVSIRPAQDKYLSPYETGGDHWVGAKGGDGDLLVPVDGKTDAYGQIPRGLIKRLVARHDVFVGTVRGIRGIWQRPPTGNQRSGQRGTKGKLETVGGKRTGLKLLYAFKSNRPVRKRLGFDQVALELVREQGTKALEAAVEKAIRSAR